MAKGQCSRCAKQVTRNKGSRSEIVCQSCRRDEWTSSCENCGAALTTRQRTQRYRFCSRGCANAALPLRGIVVDPANVVRDPYMNQRKCAQRRARKIGADSEIVDPSYIFSRDKWLCHLCGKRVDSRLNGNDPMGPTVDHVLPLSKGGEHSNANVALAHRLCNVRKGDRAVGEQLALIG